MAKGYKELSPFMRKFRIMTICFLFIYSCVSLALTINAYASLEENITVVTNTINNWKTGTISDIQVTSSSCSMGFEPAYAFTWPGVSEGCNCRDASSSDFRALGIHSSSCNSTEISEGCVNTPSVSATSLSNWGSDNSTYYSICVKRTSETFANLGPSLSGTCPTGKIKCGTSSDNVFCTSESQCPISEANVVSTSCANCIKLSSNKYLNITRGSDVLPLVEFRLNEYGMCNEANDWSKTPGRNYFTLMRSTGSSCNGEGNPLWTRIDEATEATVFSYNGLSSSISTLSSLGFYESGTSGNSFYYRLFNRGYVPFKIDCRDMITDIVDKTTDLDGIQKSHLAMLIVGCISFFMLGIVLTFMEVLNLAGCDLPCIDGKEEEERQKLLKIKRVIYFTFKFVLLPFQIWAIITLIRTKDIIQKISDESCSSTYMNYLLTRTSNSLNKAFRSDVIALALLLFFAFLAIIGGRKRDQQEAREKEQKKNIVPVTVHEESLGFNNQIPPNNIDNPSYQSGQPYQIQPQQQQILQQQQPVFQQPLYQDQPIYQQQPAYQQQPMYQQPGFQQPMYQQPGFQQPFYQPQPQPQVITIQIEPGIQQKPIQKPHQQ